MTAPGDRPHARSEITIGPLTTFARETPEEVVRATAQAPTATGKGTSSAGTGRLKK